MCGALIETELIAAVIGASFHPLEALALSLREIHNALAICLGGRIRAVVEAPPLRAVSPYKRFLTVTGPVVADPYLRAMIGVLRVKHVDVHEHQRVRTVLQVARETMQSVFASASSQSAKTITVAVLWAVSC